VTVGTKDEIYYFHSATEADAVKLGRALQDDGFFVGIGGLVRLSKGTGGTVVSFVCDGSDCDDPEAAFAFEELGRRIAGSIGGLPIKVRLMDSRWAMREELSVGQVIVGTRDEIYYFGSVTARRKLKRLAKPCEAASISSMWELRLCYPETEAPPFHLSSLKMLGTTLIG
jgi:hypothetical protein